MNESGRDQGEVLISEISETHLISWIGAQIVRCLTKDSVILLLWSIILWLLALYFLAGSTCSTFRNFACRKAFANGWRVAHWLDETSPSRPFPSTTEHQVREKYEKESSILSMYQLFTLFFWLKRGGITYNKAVKGRGVPRSSWKAFLTSSWKVMLRLPWKAVPSL